MAKRRHGRAAVRRRRPEGPTLLELLKKDQARVLRVLDAHGVSFDPVTYLTLTAPLEKVAAWHAVPDKRRFLADLLGR
ncbi:MAG: hypothetical protein KGM24_00130 [Elusimicrobia bacterium]|nr:hypothetical protein [Elusimicrobiota bacterium]